MNVNANVYARGKKKGVKEHTPSHTHTRTHTHTHTHTPLVLVAEDVDVRVCLPEDAVAVCRDAFVAVDVSLRLWLFLA